MCLIAHPLEPCSHYECLYFYQSVSGASDVSLSPETLGFVSKSLSHQTALLFQLSATNDEVLGLIQSITAAIRCTQASSSYAAKADFVLPEETNLDTLLSDMHQQRHAYSLQLTHGWPAQVSKERGFALCFRLVDAAFCAAALPEETRFRLALFTAEPTPKRLTKNISGRNVLRGSTEAILAQDGELSFPNIVVNEVSSHYFNETLRLVVYCCSPSVGVRPFVLENFQVRARRSGR